jgi:serine-type D-Ala-D-Ala carboxypeptidase (penicillin-binding protein 5/6)
MSLLRARPCPGALRAQLAVLIALLALLFAGAAEATAQGGSGEPALDARAWVLVDARDGTRLAAQAPNRKLPIASATKLMTAYIALEELPLRRRLRVVPYSAAPAESLAGLGAGERLTVRDLITAMMLPSANEAAQTVAERVAGSERLFVRRMNVEASRLGLERTSFDNPIGFDAPGTGSSATDLAELALVLREDRRFRRIVAQPETVLRSGAKRRRVVSRNTLLRADPTVDGIKTGHTLGAGYVLVGSAERRGIPLVSVVLGASSESARDSETAELLDYGYSLYSHERVARRGGRLAAAAIAFEDGRLPLVAGRGAALQVREDQRVETDVTAPAEVEGPIGEGERLGTAAIRLDGEVVERIPLLAGRAVEAPSLLARIEVPLSRVLIGGGAIAILLATLIALHRREREGGGSRRNTDDRMRSREERMRSKGSTR